MWAWAQNRHTTGGRVGQAGRGGAGEGGVEPTCPRTGRRRDPSPASRGGRRPRRPPRRSRPGCSSSRGRPGWGPGSRTHRACWQPSRTRTPALKDPASDSVSARLVPNRCSAISTLMLRGQVVLCLFVRQYWPPRCWGSRNRLCFRLSANLAPIQSRFGKNLMYLADPQSFAHRPSSA